mmetsp:Transcript_3844/g.6512  ORF Transcript_3844/g.6512 Transcript_3844/m.6512 type:complete len:132 (+) Transcript_3844:201-596(+)
MQGSDHKRPTGCVDVVSTTNPTIKFGNKTCEAVAADVHWEVLQFLKARDRSCPWDEGTCSWAAAGGHVEVLQNQFCVWKVKTCVYAVRRGQLEPWRYCSENLPGPGVKEYVPIIVAAVTPSLGSVGMHDNP